MSRKQGHKLLPSDLQLAASHNPINISLLERSVNLFVPQMKGSQASYGFYAAAY